MLLTPPKISRISSVIATTYLSPPPTPELLAMQFNVPTTTNRHAPWSSTASPLARPGKHHAKHRPHGDSPLAKLPGKACAVFPGDSTTVFRVPREDVIYIPSALVRANGTPCDVLTMCPAFARTGVCIAANGCSHAHVNVGHAVTHAAHIYPSEAVALPRSELRGRTVLVAPSQEHQKPLQDSTEGDWVLLSQCLDTLAPLSKWCDSRSSSGLSQQLRASDGSQRTHAFAGAHCGFWAKDGYCHFGKLCRFVHALPTSAAPETGDKAQTTVPADRETLLSTDEEETLRSLPTDAAGLQQHQCVLSTPCHVGLPPAKTTSCRRRQHDPYGAQPTRVAAPVPA